MFIVACPFRKIKKGAASVSCSIRFPLHLEFHPLVEAVGVKLIPREPEHRIKKKKEKKCIRSFRSSYSSETPSMNLMVSLWANACIAIQLHYYRHTVGGRIVL